MNTSAYFSQIAAKVAGFFPPDEGATPRLAGWTRKGVFALFAALIVLTVIGIDQPDNPVARTIAEKKAAGITPYSDRDLYKDIAHEVAGGASYYEVAPRLQRKHDYPVHPFPTVRLPTLSYLWVLLGDTGIAITYHILGYSALLIWWFALGRDGLSSSSSLIRPAAMILIFLSVEPRTFALHECWAGILCGIAIATYRHERPAIAIILVLIATLLRETAFPFLLALCAMALINRRQMALAIASPMIFLIVLGVHASIVQAIPPLPTDFVNTGWLRMSGWPTYVYYIQQTTIFYFLPYWVACVGVPLGLLGWLSWRSPIGFAGAAFHMGFAILFMFAGRPENVYWGFILAPSFLIGLLNVPGTLREMMAILFASPQRDMPAAVKSITRTASHQPVTLG